MSRSLIVDRASLGLAPLQLWYPPAYFLPEGGFSVGAVSWNRTSVQSPLVHGSFLTGATMNQVSSTLVVHCEGNSGAALRALLETVIQAFSQFDYRVDWDYDGMAGAWRCEPADWQVGAAGPIDELDLSLGWGQGIQLTVPRRPLPLLGRI